MEEVPFEDRYVPKAEIDWERSLWWWYPLSRAIHPALRVNALLVSAVAVAVIWIGMSLAEWLFHPRFIEEQALPSFLMVEWPLRSFEDGRVLLLRSLGLAELAYLTFALLWLTAGCGFFGGILTRRAAIELGQRTIAPWGETVRIVGSRMISYLWVTGMILVAIALMLIIPFLLGILARLGPLAFVAGFLLLLYVLPFVFAIGRLALALVICFPLAVAAISCEKNADAFEGFSRSNNYFFQRPVVAVLCLFFLVFVGMVGHWLIYWTLMPGWHWMRDSFLAGAGYDFTDLVGKPDDQVAVSGAQASRISSIVLLGGTLVRFIIHSYWFSFIWSATAAIYLVLRRSVDNTDLDEIDQPETGPVVDLPELPASPAATSPQA